MSQLDDLLRQHDEQKKKAAIAQRNNWQEESEFRDAFKKLLRDTIHDAMIEHCRIMRSHDYNAKMIRDRIESRYPYERYLFCVSNKQAVISFVGNYEVRKVCITVECSASDFSNGTSTEEQIKKTEEQYELTAVTKALIDELVFSTMKEFLPPIQ